jgi:hypothetical protein
VHNPEKKEFKRKLTTTGEREGERVEKREGVERDLE